MAKRTKSRRRGYGDPSDDLTTMTHNAVTRSRDARARAAQGDCKTALSDAIGAAFWLGQADVTSRSAAIVPGPRQGHQRDVPVVWDNIKAAAKACARTTKGKR